jgi:hypothetical protein
MLASNRLVVPWDLPESEAENYHPGTDLPIIIKLSQPEL